MNYVWPWVIAFLVYFIGGALYAWSVRFYPDRKTRVILDSWQEWLLLRALVWITFATVFGVQQGFLMLILFSLIELAFGGACGGRWGGRFGTRSWRGKGKRLDCDSDSESSRSSSKSDGNGSSRSNASGSDSSRGSDSEGGSERGGSRSDRRKRYLTCFGWEFVISMAGVLIGGTIMPYCYLDAGEFAVFDGSTGSMFWFSALIIAIILIYIFTRFVRHAFSRVTFKRLVSQQTWLLLTAFVWLWLGTLSGAPFLYYFFGSIIWAIIERILAWFSRDYRVSGHHILEGIVIASVFGYIGETWVRGALQYNLAGTQFAMEAAM